MAIVPTVSVTLKKGDKRAIVINSTDFDPAIYVLVSENRPPPPPPPDDGEDDENADAVDVSSMTVKQAVKAIESADLHVLEAMQVAEEASAGRKGVLSAIEKRHEALDG